MLVVQYSGSLNILVGQIFSGQTSTNKDSSLPILIIFILLSFRREAQDFAKIQNGILSSKSRNEASI